MKNKLKTKTKSSFDDVFGIWKNKKLTFGELKVGDRFIFFPSDGDNSGHGGYLGTHNVFIKINPCKEIHINGTVEYMSALEKVNAVSSEHGTLSQMPDEMEVIKVSK